MEFEFDRILELVELIPEAELIPQCSTSRNRMTALFFFMSASHFPPKMKKIINRLNCIDRSGLNSFTKMIIRKSWVSQLLKYS